MDVKSFLFYSTLVNFKSKLDFNTKLSPPSFWWVCGRLRIICYNFCQSTIILYIHNSGIYMLDRSPDPQRIRRIARFDAERPAE